MFYAKESFKRRRHNIQPNNTQHKRIKILGQITQHKDTQYADIWMTVKYVII
jgi:hypothetical protein